MEEIDAISEHLIDEHLDLEFRAKESRRRFYKLIRRLVRQGIPQKLLAIHCKVSPSRINQIIHQKLKPG